MHEDKIKPTLPSEEAQNEEENSGNVGEEFHEVRT